MAYITVTLNHVRAVKAWAQAHGARANLDLVTFDLEIEAGGSRFRLQPQFLAARDGHTMYTQVLRPEVNGFVGWRPYAALQTDLSRDKLVFKRALREAGLPTPEHWPGAADATGDFILKDASGSFGLGILGPYRRDEAGTVANSGATPLRRTRFAERFHRGRNLKIWFCGETAFHAHWHDYPVVTGDGSRSVADLAAARIALAPEADRATIERVLRYQELSLEHVPGEGREVWLDFRYGRRMMPDAPSAADDNDLERLSPALVGEAQEVARCVVERMRPQPSSTVIFSIDGVVEANQPWWLEVNSNPILPPSGYGPLFAALLDPPRTAKVAQ
jgi:hypothetical protein